MPSRKKAQGQARKAKQAATAASVARGSGNPTNANLVQCNHLGEHIYDFSRDDWSVADARNIVFDGYTSKVNVIEDDTLSKEIIELANDFYDNNYRRFSDIRKDLFRQIILAMGTECCLLSFAEDEQKYRRFFSYLFLMHIIEVRDRYNGAWGDNIFTEIVRYSNDFCPRVAVGFFHRQNSCDCLQEMYYKLKETYERTSWCWNCSKAVDIKLFKECTVCKLANYCSYECAVADWPKHKRICRVITKYRKQKEKIESFNDIEAVD